MIDSDQLAPELEGSSLQIRWRADGNGYVKGVANGTPKKARRSHADDLYGFVV